MPGAVPRTSTYALTNATLTGAIRLADRGVDSEILSDPGFAKGINVMRGKVTHPAVADAFGIEYTPLDSVLA